MNAGTPLFSLNPGLDRKQLATLFARSGRVQIRDVLTSAAARSVSDILMRQTPWGLCWRAGGDGPHSLRREQVAAAGADQLNGIGATVNTAMRGNEYAFLYAQYPMLEAYLGKWAPDSPQDLILEHINDQPFLDLVREITAMPELIKADAQATLYAPNHFLSLHDDSHVAEGWRVAYVLSMCPVDWRPDWGGYLIFYDDEGDIVGGFKPRFNALNLFRVPQKHNVSYVAPFAPVARFAITGWFRDH